MDAQHIRRTVVVGVDGSESALRATRWGAAEAGRRQVPLRLIIAFGWPADHHHGHPGRGRRYREVLLDRARAHLAEAAVVAGNEVPGLAIEQQLVVGSAIPVLGEEAHRAHLIVIGDRGMGRVEGLLVGSVAVALAAHAACPVVVVRGIERAPADASLPVVVGVDGSSTSEAAIAFAFDAAARRGVPLVAVHTWSDLAFDPSMAAMLLDWADVEADERQLLADRVSGWIEKYPNVPVEQVLTRDRPAPSLLERAAGAQLVVVGSRGRGEFTGLVLGSVSNALVHRAPCPVAIVRPDTTASPSA
ncbi:MAG: universal stress protein [Pseudonocardia sp.]|nr:universal stress protein [Pseudonocardia sp.]